jgi:phosphoribosylamine--glycine ligase
MNILLLGSGGREHALALSLTASASLTQLYAAPGNPGILQIAQKADCSPANHSSVIEFCRKADIGLVVIGPEAPLVAGLSDELRQAGIPVFGPSSAAARIEASKGFAKELMQKYSIPTAAYRNFTAQQWQEAHIWADQQALPLVIKADGLAAGKGVIIAYSKQEAHQAIDEIFGGAFANAGASLVIEEFLLGQEASVFAISDGESYIVLPAAQDHKRALDGDQGKNTGGMGSYAPAPLITPIIMERIEQRIIQPVLQAMKQEGMPFSGCLFCGLMIDSAGNPNVIEFNCRFGDPETQSVLNIMEGDMALLFYQAATGALSAQHIPVRYKGGYACTVVMASKGYPDTYSTGYEIKGIEQAISIPGITVYHAGTALSPTNTILTAGGRVLGICAHAETLKNAIETAYTAVSTIQYQGAAYRTDIGQKGLV